MPLGEVARRLGHSVEILVSVYVGALEGDDQEANRRIDSACEATRAWLAEDDDPGKKSKHASRRRSRPESA